MPACPSTHLAQRRGLGLWGWPCARRCGNSVWKTLGGCMSGLGHLPWIAVAVGLAGFGDPAFAAETPRPLTLDEALREGVAHNGALAQAGYARDQAEASIVAAHGAFDPLYSAALSGATQKDRTYENGAVDLTTRAWFLDQSIAGELPTG